MRFSLHFALVSLLFLAGGRGVLTAASQGPAHKAGAKNAAVASKEKSQKEARKKSRSANSKKATAPELATDSRNRITVESVLHPGKKSETVTVTTRTPREIRIETKTIAKKEAEASESQVVEVRHAKPESGKAAAESVQITSRRANAETLNRPARDVMASEIVIDVGEQELVVRREDETVATYPISTSKFGLGDEFRSYKTPVGAFRVSSKIGANLPEGAVLKRGRFTGEVLKPNAPGRDPIVTRMIQLSGLEKRNSNSAARGIFIHGTPEERNIGKPVSYGCIRMRSKDVVKIYSQVDVGTRVTIKPTERRTFWERLTFARKAEPSAEKEPLAGKVPANKKEPRKVAEPQEGESPDDIAKGSPASQKSPLAKQKTPTAKPGLTSDARKKLATQARLVKQTPKQKARRTVS